MIYAPSILFHFKTEIKTRHCGSIGDLFLGALQPLNEINNHARNRHDQSDGCGIPLRAALQTNQAGEE
jgi:hypothetical protein